MLTFLSVYFSPQAHPRKLPSRNVRGLQHLLGWLFGKALMCCYFSFNVKVPWGPLDSCGLVTLGLRLDPAVCDQKRCSRVGLVGNGGGGLFHIFKDNIITSCLRREWKYLQFSSVTQYVRESKIVRQMGKSYPTHQWQRLRCPNSASLALDHPSACTTKLSLGFLKSPGADFPGFLCSLCLQSFFLSIFIFNLFLVGGLLLYNVFISTIQQCESAISTHIPSPSYASLPLPPILTL